MMLLYGERTSQLEVWPEDVPGGPRSESRISVFVEKRLFNLEWEILTWLVQRRTGSGNVNSLAVLIRWDTLK